MAVQQSTIRFFAGTLLAAVLTACGGGGDGDPLVITSTQSIADKYAGTWVGCNPVSGGGSTLDTLTFTKTSETTLNLAVAFKEFASNDCSGAVVATGSGDGGAVTFNGTKAIGSETVDRITVTGSTPPPVRQILLIRGDGKLYSGDDSGSFDAQGYPNAIDPDALTRQ